MSTGDFDDFDVSEFETPPTNVERFLATNPRYAEEVASSLKPSANLLGVTAGKVLQTQLLQLTRKLSNTYGARLHDLQMEAAIQQLPVSIDTSDLDRYLQVNGQHAISDFFEEVGDDFLMELADRATFEFITAMKPYLVSSLRVIADGMDWALQAPVSDFILEGLNTPEIPEELEEE